VGWLSRLDLRSRPQPAGPGLRTPAAQCEGPLRARLALCFGPVPQVEAWDAELGLRAVPAGPDPVVAPGRSLVALDGANVVLSALKPPERRSALIARVLNPTDEAATATMRVDLPMREVRTVRLDETSTDAHDQGVDVVDGQRVRLTVAPHALLT